ncbi:MAG TPA: acetyl-CoA C-acetyltransferase, partial [Chromatiales bacterium]|nr:acetyl-CoA C-acetyltransferase [Chromatiales bacterium]
MNQDAVVIVAARRTPIGSFLGSLSAVSAPELAAVAIQACLKDAELTPDCIEQALIGCVLQAGIGQAPARQAALASGMPDSVDCTTINKVCGSAMKATVFAHDMIRAGSTTIAVAGGMESMSNAPYLLPKARSGYRMGHQQAIDHMLYDGLQNPYDGQSMGFFGDQTACKYDFSREQQDSFSIASVERALAAIASGAFDAEIAPVVVRSRKGDSVV